MAAAKLKRRRGAKSSGKSHMLKLLILAAILIVAGVMFTLVGGLREALIRQALHRGGSQSQLIQPLVHGEMNKALTRPSVGGVEGRLRRNHEQSIMEQAQERERRINEMRDQRLMNREQIRDKVLLAAGGAAHDTLAQGHIPHAHGEHSHQTIPEVQMPPPEQLGGPYPYPLDPPPANYDIHESYTPKGGFRFGEYTNGDAPYQITDELRQKSDDLARVRREYVKKMMQTAWKGYVDNAFGMDEIKPASARGDNSWGGFGVTLVDTLDSLWLMGMKDEFWQARDWVRDHLKHDKAHAVSVFETTIRSLGGLLSAYDWSGDKTFLDSALDLGKRLANAFNNSPTGLPFGQINLADGKSSNINWARGNVILSELGSIQLEFRMLDQCVKSPETQTMRHKTENVYEVMNRISPPNGLFPYYLSNSNSNGIPSFTNDHLTFGAMADSFYEYMLKVWIQGGKVEPLYRQMYDKAMQGMHEELVKKSEPSGLTFIADKIGTSRYDLKMDHLVCK
jgi:Glycosyl hydrolase family 47